MSEKFSKFEQKVKKRFLKYIVPNENEITKGQWLRKKAPCAYLLLSQIAERARRYNGHPDGFEIGWALIGDYEDAGLSHRQYRTAIEFLETSKFIKILYKGKKDKKSTIKTTIKRTIKGTIVKLIDSEVWDINKESGDNQNDNQSDNHPTITRQSPDNEQERIKKEERKNKENIAKTALPLCKKISFSFEKGEFENVTFEDFERLQNNFPGVDVSHSFEQMIPWILERSSTLKRKKNWEEFIINWLEKVKPAKKNNYDIAKQILNSYKSDFYEIVMDEKVVGICALNGRGGIVETLSLFVHGFEDQLILILEKRGFKRISKIENLPVYRA